MKSDNALTLPEQSAPVLVEDTGANEVYCGSAGDLRPCLYLEPFSWNGR